VPLLGDVPSGGTLLESRVRQRHGEQDLQWLAVLAIGLDIDGADTLATQEGAEVDVIALHPDGAIDPWLGIGGQLELITGLRIAQVETAVALCTAVAARAGNARVAGHRPAPYSYLECSLQARYAGRR